MNWMKLNQKEAMSTKPKVPVVKVPGTFVKVNNDRILKSAIKRYAPNGTTSVNIYFNTSTFKVDVRNYDLNSKQNQNKTLDYLDSIYL